MRTSSAARGPQSTWHERPHWHPAWLSWTRRRGPERTLWKLRATCGTGRESSVRSGLSTCRTQVRKRLWRRWAGSRVSNSACRSRCPMHGLAETARSFGSTAFGHGIGRRVRPTGPSSTTIDRTQRRLSWLKPSESGTSAGSDSILLGTTGSLRRVEGASSPLGSQRSYGTTRPGPNRFAGGKTCPASGLSSRGLEIGRHLCWRTAFYRASNRDANGHDHSSRALQ